MNRLVLIMAILLALVLVSGRLPASTDGTSSGTSGGISDRNAVGINFGQVTSTSSTLEDYTRDQALNLGLEYIRYLKAWGFGLSYDYSAKNTGEGIVQVNQTNHWLAADARYRFNYENSVSPYLLLGYGPFFQVIETKIYNVSQTDTGLSWGLNFGGGVNLQVTGPLSLDLKLKFFRYSVVSGVEYLAGLQYVF